KRFYRRDWLYYVSALVIIFAMGHLAGAAQKEQSFVKARSILAHRFELRRADGKIAASLSEGRQGDSALVFFDREGHSRLSVGLADSGAQTILMYGQDQRTKIGLTVNAANDEPHLQPFDDSGDTVISASVWKGLGPELKIGKVGRSGISLQVTNEG